MRLFAVGSFLSAGGAGLYSFLSALIDGLVWGLLGFAVVSALGGVCYLGYLLVVARRAGYL